MKSHSVKLAGLAVVLLGLGGCAAEVEKTVEANPAPPSPLVAQARSFRPAAEAGIDLTPPADAATFWTTAVQKPFGFRPDPFALHPSERSFEIDQTEERVFSETGGFSVNFEEKKEVVVIPVIEPQPYRRLAGVIVGDSVLALIDMGDGGSLQLIRPGQLINGWRVVSIDSDKAILRRGGNKLPKEVIVRLESPPMGSGGSGGSGGNPGGGPATGGSGGAPASGPVGSGGG